jgi:hypothetical protein
MDTYQYFFALCSGLCTVQGTQALWSPNSFASMWLGNDRTIAREDILIQNNGLFKMNLALWNYGVMGVKEPSARNRILGATALGWIGSALYGWYQYMNKGDISKTGFIMTEVQTIGLALCALWLRGAQPIKKKDASSSA